MPDFRFAFQTGGAERIELSAGSGFEGATLRLDGRELTRFASAAELRAGASFTLAGGGVLHVQLRAPLLLPELHVELDGHPLAGSAGHGPTRLRFGGNLLLAIASLAALSALLRGLGSFLGFLPSTGLGLVDAALLGACGWYAQRGSRSALLAGIGLHVAATLGAVVMLMPEAGAGLSGAITLRILFAALLVRAWLPPKSVRGRPRIPPQAAAEPEPRPAAAPASAQALEIRRRQASVSAQAERMTGASAVDQARRSLDHVALRCVAADAGLDVTPTNGRPHCVAWSDLHRVVVRMLPTDPPYGGQVLLDLWPAKGTPVRLMPTTVTQGFAPSAVTSRIDRARAQAIEILQRAGDASADPATQAFLDGTAKIARFATPHALHEYELAGPDALDA